MTAPESNEPTIPLSQVRTASVPVEASPARPALAHLPAGAVISRYRIESVLGEGGMGVVYLARQEKPAREVALKVVRPGYATKRMLRRFELEAEVLGRLLHPGIAQIYEAGTADAGHGPQPFFAMELVKGVSLTRYASEQKLTTRQRMELLAKVCDAVHHAHQKGVIHRDLKPGNILVTEEGQPKILDFGLARATDSDVRQSTVQTDVGAVIGTLPYMSPEQVAGDPADLDTRSDVYTLGVIAYELLVGRLPYSIERGMLHEAARIIKEEEPTRLSSIDRALRGDVETIVAHALEKDKARRYGAASALAADIRRYLSDEPIAARPASTWYQLSKFSRRNKGLVAGLTTAFVFLAAGLVASLVQRAEAISARDAAELWRSESDLSSQFLGDTLKGAGPSVARGRDITMLKEMMDHAAERIERGELKSAPNVELRLRGTIGYTYKELAVYDSAQRLLESVVARARSLYPGDHAATAHAMNNLGLLLQARGDVSGAEPLLRDAVAMWKRLAPGDSVELAAGLNNLASVLKDRGDSAGAEELFRESLEMWKRSFAGDCAEVATGLNNLASMLQARGDLTGAEPLFRASVDMLRRLFPGDHPSVAHGLNNLATLLQARDDLAGAEPFFRESLEMWKRLFRGDAPEVALGLNSLSELLQARNEVADAEPLLRESVEMYRRLYNGDHRSLALGLNNLAFLLQSRNDLAGAELMFRESLEMRRRLFHGDHTDVAISLGNLAEHLRARGDTSGAETYSREALAMHRRLFPQGHPDVARDLNNLAYLLRNRNDPAAAEVLYVESLDMCRRWLPRQHLQTLVTIANLADLREDTGNPAKAEPLRRELLEVAEELFPAGHWRIADACSRLGRCLCAQTRFGEAEPLAIAGYNGLLDTEDAAHISDTRLQRACERVVDLYEAWDKSDPGKGYDTKAAEWKAKLDALTEAPPTPK